MPRTTTTSLTFSSAGTAWACGADSATVQPTFILNTPLTQCARCRRRASNLVKPSAWAFIAHALFVWRFGTETILLSTPVSRSVLHTGWPPESSIVTGIPKRPNSSLCRRRQQILLEGASTLHVDSLHSIGVDDYRDHHSL